MKNWKECNEIERLDIINRAALEGKGNTALGRELGVNESTIRKFKANKCIKDGKSFVLKDITNSNTVVVEQVPNYEINDVPKDVTNSNTVVVDESTSEKEVIPLNENNKLADIDTEKLNVLLNSLDDLLKLIPNKNCIYRSNVIEVRSLRIDTGLYEELKHRANVGNSTISEYLNRALEEYLSNHI